MLANIGNGVSNPLSCGPITLDTPVMRSTKVAVITMRSGVSHGGATIACDCFLLRGKSASTSAVNTMTHPKVSRRGAETCNSSAVETKKAHQLSNRLLSQFRRKEHQL